VENLSRIPRRGVSPAGPTEAEGEASRVEAQGRLPGLVPVAVVDIGSNSVRLVVYEGLNRTPTPLYNEKVLCGLGKGLASTGKLSSESVSSALQALARFRFMADQLQVGSIRVVATAAVRDAANGEKFIARAEEAIGAPVRVLSGGEEARFAALGVVSGFHRPSGIVGDLGGGSLETIRVCDGVLEEGATLPLGGLRLKETSGGDVAAARRIVRDEIAKAGLPSLEGREPFYAIGGTWRAFANLHIGSSHYPLRVLHHYAIRPKEVLSLARELRRFGLDKLPGHEEVSSARKSLLPYGALVLDEVIRHVQPSSVIVSAYGLREGLLYLDLPQSERDKDPLLSAAEELAVLRSRSPEHARELVGWTARLVEAMGLEEDGDERRLREAACLLADIGWRAHPDYRGEQSLNIIANAAFAGIDHPGRAFLALTVFFRHAGDGEHQIGPGLRSLVDLQQLRRARLLGSALRLAYRLSGSMPGVLPHVTFAREEEGGISMRLVPRLGCLLSSRIETGFRRVARLNGMSGDVKVD
jgi:exopolyphosphatase/guanosine-5'-triphosphate,3'-diphosphate pyrophosphatase